MAQREDVQFPSGGDLISAWLYRPPGSGPAPLLVMAHGLGAVRSMRLDAYAERFSAAGYACLVFDYRNFGDSEGKPRQVLDVGLQLADWAAAVAYARTLPGIDPDRIALWGTSFAGGHVIATAARLPGIAAAVVQCPFTDAVASIRTLSPLIFLRVGILGARDLIAARLGKPPVMIPTVGRPGEVALMNAPDAYPGYLKLVPEGADIPQEVAARIALKIMAYRPGRLTPKIACPILFCVCEADSVAPAAPTLRYAAKAPHGEVKLYPEGHFAIYVDEAFDRVVADQIAFLDKHLKGT
ncbi:alpha/beta hydrolase [Mycobacterium nebraskense]|uniref:Alpha/beta hydrolase n=1 Tax=Mycobacterium nebraskense TaxID=244292 RepID=A0A0F5NC44_9MYCO|nr:alpha/beta fold hydrolase [Mycobacterium nebraskense]KKC04629.1 alpha/beta hydrolase [Mycobacterium nebraskense]KLO44141.1 alpha/beta hydrolase [Mycobacterium nebraskense]MBI2696285.1 alpha/beta fold hydrolase [Mycobacterium nebraskense]MCV7119702.1 alpha/beta fold hydrolase [Mycobacterium nebraskense]ORW28410.1 alpha/beta hydrolase [Mycobacterium nebraskense]